jgi:hypothetical protein
MITEPPPENGVLDFSSLFSPEYLLEEAIGPPKAAFMLFFMIITSNARSDDISSRPSSGA